MSWCMKSAIISVCRTKTWRRSRKEREHETTQGPIAATGHGDIAEQGRCAVGKDIFPNAGDGHQRERLDGAMGQAARTDHRLRTGALHVVASPQHLCAAMTDPSPAAFHAPLAKFCHSWLRLA